MLYVQSSARQTPQSFCRRFSWRFVLFKTQGQLVDRVRICISDTGAQYSQHSGPHALPSYVGSGFAAPVQHASHYPQLTPLTPDLPQCQAPGCYRKVHYDSELGPFDYCSPECRDQHLLPIEREKLKADIAKFSSEISSLPSFVPSSDKGSHDVRGLDPSE